MTLSPDTKRVLRTALQIVVGLASALPLLIHTANLPDTLPGVAVALTVAGFITKGMAKYDRLLPAWLRLDVPPAWAPMSPRHATGPTAPLDGSTGTPTPPAL